MINEIRKKLYDLIVAKQATPGSRFTQLKAVLIGDPFLFAESELPALCIVGEDGSIMARGTEYDTQVRQLEIRVFVNIKNYLGDASHPERIGWDYALAELVEWSVDDPGDSIVGFLRENFSLKIDGVTKSRVNIQGEIKWQYGENQKGEDPLHECRISFGYQVVTDRR